MAVKAFKIVFEDVQTNPKAVYKSGQHVTFGIHLTLAEPVKCNEPETEGPDAGYHPAGQFIYPMTFQLPPTAPSSFEGGIGIIRYLVKVTMDQSPQASHLARRFFTVIRELDLNTMPLDLVGPFSMANEFSVNVCSCLGCCYGWVQVTMSMDKKGYVPGERLHIRGEIRNTSKSDFDKIVLKICQKCTFKAQGNSKETIRVVVQSELPGVPKGEAMQLNHRIPLGAVPSSFIEGCGNIDIGYTLRMKAVGGICTQANEECCQLIIGTVPLRTPPPSAPAGETTPVITAEPTSTALSPPSYEECTFGRVQMDKEDGKNCDAGEEDHWAPSYPVFSAASAPPMM